MEKEISSLNDPYTREVCADYILIEATGRKEAIDKLSEFVNKLKYDTLIMISLYSVCKSFRGEKRSETDES
jgi:hypothetical protein